MHSKVYRMFKRLFKVCSCSSSVLALLMLISTNTESSIFTSVTNICPNLSRFMFKMFKAYLYQQNQWQHHRVGFTMREK